MGCSPWGRKESGMTEQLTLTYTWGGDGIEIGSNISLSLSLFFLLYIKIYSNLEWKTEIFVLIAFII